MVRSVRKFALTLAVLIGSGCTSAPPLVLFGTGPQIAPAGPKVASLMVNLKCELWDAGNSTETIPYYTDGPRLVEHKDDIAREPDQKIRDAEFPISAENPRTFNLRNLFQEIEYVGDVQLILDVNGSGAFNPSITASKYYSAMKGLLPATGAVLSVGGQLSDTGHRNIQIDTSVDFGRLVAIPPGLIDIEFQNRKQEPVADIGAANCDNYKPDGWELQGQLHLKESLATSFIAVAMNDIAVSPDSSVAATNQQAGPNTPSSSIQSQTPAPTLDETLTQKLADLLKNSGTLTAVNQYLFGTIQIQTDFTVVEGINGGPNWTLDYFKFPSASGGGGSGGGGASGGSGGGGGGSGLLNFNRQVKDTLLLTLVPVCIREKYHVVGANIALGGTPDFSLRFRRYKHSGLQQSPDPRDPSHYLDEMMVGTPFWANSLPPCPPYGSAERQGLENSALGYARYNSLLRFPMLGQ